MAEECKKIECDYANQGYLDPWPPVRGEYRLGDPRAGVAVVTLASVFNPRGTAISGPCKTENLGLEKIVANVITLATIFSNPRFSVLQGPDMAVPLGLKTLAKVTTATPALGSPNRYSPRTGGQGSRYP